MSKYKTINLFDKIFITVSIFLIIYSWIIFFIKNLWLTFILSLIFSFASVFILFYFLERRRTQRTIKNTKLKDIEEKFLSFLLMSKNEKLNFLKSVAEADCECKKINDYLLCYYEGKTTQILLATDTEKLNQFELIKQVSLKEKNVNELKIICCEYEQNLNTKILTDLDIKILSKEELYDEFFSVSDTLKIPQNLNTKNQKKKLKEIAKNFFTPRKAKLYFCWGLIMIFSSIILPFHTYYLIFGSTLLIISVICKLMPIFNH